MPEVLTHKGFKPFGGILDSINNETKIKIEIDSGEVLNCTQNHRLKLYNDIFIEAKELNVSDVLYGNKLIKNISKYDSSECVYDLINVKDTNSYYTNNLVSHNCVMMDEFAHVHNNLAEEFFTSTYPVISSGTSTKIIIVSTPRGMNLYYRMWMDAVAGKSDYFPVDIHWSRIPGRDEEWREKTIRNTSLSQFRQEFGCEFHGSTNTLIDGAKLQIMLAKEPLELDDNDAFGMEIFEKPIKEYYDDETQKMVDKDHIYVLCADVSEGKNLDYTTFSVFDCSTIPYRQVAIYRNNRISPMLFPDVLRLCAEYYNNAHVLIEINNNPQVADILYQDLEYENVFKVYSGNKQAQILSELGKATQNGLNMSPLVKRTGCSALKTIVETNKLEINSAETIYELSRFIASNNSFSAEEGAHDDLAMTLVMFAWVTTQKLFIELSSTDIRKRLQIEHNYAKEEDEEMPPMPQFADSLKDKYTFESGDLWEIVEQEDHQDLFNNHFMF